MAIELAGYEFEGPFDNMEEALDESGVFAVVCGAVAPQVDVVDVGEAEKVRVRLQSHDRTPCWERDCDKIRFVVRYTPELDQEGRREIEGAIREQHDVTCGSMGQDASREFSRRKPGGPSGATP